MIWRYLRGPLQWTVFTPVLSLVLMVATWTNHSHPLVLAAIAVGLVGAVLAAVHHAEVVAHRVGEPFGSLLLAVAVTVIEVGLIVSLMIAGGEATSTYARDTVFAAVMLILNGIVGLSLLTGALKHHLVSFNPTGTGSALSTVITLASVTMVLPGFLSGGQGVPANSATLAFAAITSLALYVMFVLTQTIKHRDFFLPVTADANGQMTGLVVDADGDGHADPPPASEARLSLGLLLVALLSVVGLAKLLSPTIEDVVITLGFPHGAVGVVIAMLVLAPESIAAVRNARRNRVQISLNLAYGSAMASIGLTIPTLAIALIWLDVPLVLSLESDQLALLAISAIVAVLTVVQGRAKTLQGLVHLVLLAAFLFVSLQH